MVYYSIGVYLYYLGSTGEDPEIFQRVLRRQKEVVMKMFGKVHALSVDHVN